MNTIKCTRGRKQWLGVTCCSCHLFRFRWDSSSALLVVSSLPSGQDDTDVISKCPISSCNCILPTEASQLCNCFALNFDVHSPRPFCQVSVRTCCSESLSRWSSACGRRSPHHCHTHFQGLGICYCRAHLRDREKGNIIICVAWARLLWEKPKAYKPTGSSSSIGK